MRRLVEAEIPPELAAPLDTLAAMLSAPECADAQVVAQCCTHVASWADDSRARETALAYAQAAAPVLPGDAHAAADGHLRFMVDRVLVLRHRL